MSEQKPNGSCKRAYIYARVSEDQQAEQHKALDQQEYDTRQYCEDRGLSVAEVFRDAGFSGSDRSRPGLVRMLLLANSDDQPVDVIVASDLTRVARDLESSIVLKGQLERAGVELQFVHQTP
ncbi:recombinase family protein [Qipengyuania sp.]|uniref:recombinase family protein n=1 Tax=Qipengyuania sp. TaxID=2004515 RepID=UPI0037354AE0